MLKFTIEGLKDRNGNAAQIGDLVRVTLPGARIDNNHWQIAGYNRLAHNQAIDIIAVLCCAASKGLMLKVVEILTPLKGSDPDIKTGVIFKFSSKKWTWEVLKQL